MSIQVTIAEAFKSYLAFIDDWDKKKNISYHLQYIEFLYKIKKIHEPTLTTLSLSNKTIIIEYFTVIEAIIDALLCQLLVKVDENHFVQIEINEYTGADELLKLAKKYKIISQDIHTQLGQIKGTRNRIHIKRPRKKQKYEYKEYTKELLEKYEKTFKVFLEYLFKKNNIAEYKKYPWPWKVKL